MSESDTYDYYAFISYKRGGKDEICAKWLQKKLEQFRIPTEIVTSGNKIPKRLKVFRDKTDLGSHANLHQGLTTSLSKSRFLIVVCSPRSAESSYVDDEVRFFQEQGRGAQVIPFIIDGTPAPKEGEQQCYPPSLSANILGVTLAEGSQEEALVKTVARLLEVDYATLYQRHLRAQKRFYVKIATGALVVIVSLLFLLAWAVNAEQRATAQRAKAEEAERVAVAQRKEAEDLVRFLTIDLRDEAFAYIPLKGQQRIIEKVEAYYSKWESESLAGIYTRVVHLDNQAKALMTEGKLAEALVLAEKAQAVVKVFLEYFPDNASLLKDVGALCGNVGVVLSLQGKEREAADMFAEAHSLLKRALVMDPANLDLRQRLLQLAGVQCGAGDARLHKNDDAFVNEIQLLYEQTQDMAGDLPLSPEIFELALRFCQVLPAEEWRKRQVFCDQALSMAEALVKEDQYNFKRLANVGEALSASASLKSDRSDYAAASALQERCVAMSRLLTEKDPSDLHFQFSYGSALHVLGSYEVLQGKTENGNQLLQESKAIQEEVYKKSPDAQMFRLLQPYSDIAERTELGLTTSPEQVKPTASALKKARALVEERPENTGALLSLIAALLNHAHALCSAEMYAQALPVGQELVILVNAVAAAQDSMPEGLRMRLFHAHLTVGKAYQGMFNFEDARLAYENALELALPKGGAPQSSVNLEEVSMALSSISRALEQEGRVSEALAYSETMLEIDRQRYYSKEPDISSEDAGTLAGDYAYAATVMAVQWLSLGNYEKGVPFLQEAVPPGREWVNHKSVLLQGQGRSFYSSILSYLILAHAETGCHEEAMALAAEAEALYPAEEVFWSNAASLADVQFRLYRSIALAFLLHGEPEKALAPACRASEAGWAYYAASAKNIGSVPREVVFYAWAAEMKTLRLAGKAQDALVLLEKIAPLCRELMLTPGVEIAGDAAGSVLIDGALVNLGLGRLQEAQRLSEEAAILVRAKWRKNPNEVDALQAMAQSSFAQGDIAVAEGRTPEAITLYEQSLEITRSLVQLEPRHLGWRKEHATTLQRVGELYQESGNGALAKEREGELARLLR